MALVAEGPSDHRFLPPVLYRLTEDLCLTRGRGTVEVGPVTSLEPVDSGAGSYTARLVEAARQASGTYHVLFLHSDGGGDGEAARRERTEPWTVALEDLGREEERFVAVVPIREMEAWAICDGEALRQAFGTTLNDAQLGVQAVCADVERLPIRNRHSSSRMTVCSGQDGLAGRWPGFSRQSPKEFASTRYVRCRPSQGSTRIFSKR